MIYKLRRAINIFREQGLSVVAKKSLQYIPIEVNNVFYRLQHQSPTKVMDEDWDNLIILDACRFDLFKDVCDLKGNLAHRISLGSTSEEFLERNFTGGEHFDTVYVNANPYVSYLDLNKNTFHAVIDLLDKWDDELQTVPPEVVAKAATDAHESFPNKRLIVHFMQPHTPFIGDVGREIEAAGWDPDQESGNLEGANIWQRLRNQSDSESPGLDTVWKAYEENLEIALEHVHELLLDLDGDSVITSDHGNMVGERLSPIPSKKIYGHPLGVYHPNLVKVPWFRVEGDARRTIEKEPPVREENIDTSLTEERLEALGYK